MTKPIPGPDPHPRKPKLAAPARSCDCHNHVFGPASRFPYVLERQYTPPDAPLEDFLRMLGILGIERAVIVQPSVYGTDHRCTEEAIQRMGGQARGIAVVRSNVDGAELRRLDDAGFRGARFNLVHTGGSTPLDELEALAAKVEPIGWHIQIYLRGRILPDIASRLRALPVPVVIDHLGHMECDQGIDQAGFQTLLKLMDTGRTWVKLCPYRFDSSGAPYDLAKPFAQALARAAPDRLVWGTDWPHPDVPGDRPGEFGPMPNDGDLLDALAWWFEDETLIRQILVDNPATLYGFE